MALELDVLGELDVAVLVLPTSHALGVGGAIRKRLRDLASRIDGSRTPGA